MKYVRRVIYALLLTATVTDLTESACLTRNQENIRGFDVREFYVKLVADLKRRGTEIQK